LETNHDKGKKLHDSNYSKNNIAPLRSIGTVNDYKESLDPTENGYHNLHTKRYSSTENGIDTREAQKVQMIINTNSNQYIEESEEIGILEVFR
jgi:hypothetical protein